MKASQSRQLEREIEVVKHIIDQLNQCLEIYHDAKLHDEFTTTLKDIQTCKRELKRLIAKRTVELDVD
jgi:seryl-tRNA(Sec) selenium transferase